MPTPRINPVDYEKHRLAEAQRVIKLCTEKYRLIDSDLVEFREALIEQAELGPFAERLTNIAGVCVNNPDASFWLQRRGTPGNVGRPALAFKRVAQGGKYDAYGELKAERGEDIGICLRRPDIVSAKYLRFWFEMLWRKGFWQQHNYGTLMLKHIRISDARDLVVTFNP
jgi:hypothetical protein